MNQSIIKVISTSLLLTVLLFTGCTKDTLVGPTGPIGPTGATGPQGNANVEEFDFSTSQSSWTQSTNGSWHASYGSVTINKTDAIMVYMVVGQNSIALPNIDPQTGVYTGFSYNTETVTINVYTVPGSTTTITNPLSQQYKISIIPS